MARGSSRRVRGDNQTLLEGELHKKCDLVGEQSDADGARTRNLRIDSPVPRTVAARCRFGADVMPIRCRLIDAKCAALHAPSVTGQVPEAWQRRGQVAWRLCRSLDMLRP